MHDINRSLQSQKITIIGAIVNLLLSIGKIIIGFIGKSQALIADGIHSLSDLLSDVMVWYAARHAALEADEDHPYGHGRFETVATLGLGLLLIMIALGIAYDGIYRILYPEKLSVPEYLALIMAFVSIVSKELMYWYTLKVAKQINSAMLKANAWHHRSDAVSSIIVFIGIGGAMLGFKYFDAIAAIIVGLMIAYLGWKFAAEALKELVDTGLEKKQTTALHEAISAVDGVQNLHMLRTRRHAHKIGADLHVQVKPFITVSEGHKISLEVEKAARLVVEDITDITVHIDPEDDEEYFTAVKLPNRQTALEIIKKNINDIKYQDMIQKIRLHYFDNKVYVDFYLALSCLEQKSNTEIKNCLCSALDDIAEFGEVKIYYSE